MQLQSDRLEMNDKGGITLGLGIDKGLTAFNTGIFFNILTIGKNWELPLGKIRLHGEFGYGDYDEFDLETAGTDNEWTTSETTYYYGPGISFAFLDLMLFSVHYGYVKGDESSTRCCGNNSAERTENLDGNYFGFGFGLHFNF